MAKASLLSGGPMMFPVGGMDESVQSTSVPTTFEKVEGVAPFYIGSHQRLFAKRLVDNNPQQQVYAIAQGFNGYGQYGYFVQSKAKLYYHLCDGPSGLNINFVPPAEIGFDENDHSLDIYGQRPDSTSPPDSVISCLFGFPDKAANYPFDRFGFDTWQEGFSPAPGYVYHGFIVVRKTGGSSPYTETIATFLKSSGEGVLNGYAQQGSTIDLHDFFDAYAGTQKFGFFRWYKNGANSTYVYDGQLLQSYLDVDGITTVPYPSIGVTLTTGQTINYPPGDALHSGTFTNFLFTVSNTATDQAVFRFQQAS